MKILTLSIVLILILFYSTTCFSSEGQAWDAIHITGSCIGTLYLNKVVKMPYWKSAATMFVLGIAWEYFGDEMYRRGHYGRNLDFIFDKRGFHRNDVLRNGIGITLSFPIR